MKIKHFYSFLSLSVTSCIAYAQVGINTPTPQATLDIVGNGGNTSIKDGMMPPRVTKQQLASKAAGTYASAQNGALIYVTDITAPSGVTPSLVQVANINSAGYYYFDGIQWTAYVNIYNSNGILSGTRTVTTGGNQLNFSNGANSSVAIATTTTEGRVIATGTNRGSLTLTSNGSTLNLFQDTSSLAQITTTGTSTGLNITNTGSTPINLATNGITRMTVTGAGNVGIGAPAPSNALHVNATDPLRLQGLSVGNTTTDPLMVIDATGVVKTIGTLGALSIPSPAIFRLDTAQNNFLNGVGAGSSSVVPMSLVKNSIPGMTYNAGTSTITFPAGTYQMTFMYEATHDNTPSACAVSSYIVDFPLASGTARVHSTAAHNIGALSNHGGTVTYTPTLPTGTTWQIRLGRGQSGSCGGTGMTLFASSTLLLVFRIGD